MAYKYVCDNCNHMCMMDDVKITIKKQPGRVIALVQSLKNKKCFQVEELINSFWRAKP